MHPKINNDNSCQSLLQMISGITYRRLYDVIPSKSGHDVLASFSITLTGHIGTMKLGGIVEIMTSLEFLGHQEQPIFKSGFFSISKQRRVRDLS